MKFNPLLENITSYEAGKPIELVVREFGVEPSKVVKLASNENPHGTSSKVVKTIADYAKNMALYPDDSYFELKDALATFYGVKSPNVIIGSGSDQVIEFCVHAKAHKNTSVLMSKTTFAMYEIYSKLVGAKIIKTTSNEHNLGEFYDEYKKHKSSIVFLCLPNNPLGECLDKDDVYEFIAKLDKETLVVVDGAYQEYVSYKDEAKKINPSDLIAMFENAIYLGTFSKAYGLGGMRVGYGIAHEDIIKILHKLRPPFNITTLSLKAAIEALKDQEHVKKSVEDNFSQMKRFEYFCLQNNLDFIPSYTNFITIKLTKHDSSKIAQALLEKGVIIRNLKSYGLNAIRITVGTSVQNDRFFEEITPLIMQG